MRGNHHWVEIQWVVLAIDEDGHEWVKEMGECDQCHKPSDRLFVCHEVGKQYCPDCIKKGNLIKVLL